MAMDMVQPTQGMDVDSGDQTKTTEKGTVTEASQEIRGTGFGFRDRKKSKYLSYPYTTSEEVETPNGSASSAQLGSNRFRTNRHKEFISLSRMSSSPEFINASPKELLSELLSKAVDSMFPTDNKSFELVEWFFSRYRMSTFHDEAELATSLVDEKEGKTGKRVDSNLLDNKSGKKRKDNKMDNAVKRKTKSLCGLSDNGQSKEELVLTGSNPELCISNEGLAGNSANLSLVESKALEAGTVFQEGPIGNISDHNFDVDAASEGGTISQKGLVGNIDNQLKSRVEKPAEEHHQTKNVTELNGICTEFDLIRKEVETVNVLTPGVRSGQSRSLSTCSRPFNNDIVVEANGESQPGTVLLLQFAPGAYIPSKNELLTTFSQFGPLKASESLSFEGTGIAQIIFFRSTDAGEAFHSLEKNKPFGTALADYKRYRLPAACPSVERLVTPTQPARPVSKPLPPVSVSMPMPVPVPTRPMSKPVPVNEPAPVPVSTPLPHVSVPVPVPTRPMSKSVPLHEPAPVPLSTPMSAPLPHVSVPVPVPMPMPTRPMSKPVPVHVPVPVSTPMSATLPPVSVHVPVPTRPMSKPVHVHVPAPVHVPVSTPMPAPVPVSTPVPMPLPVPGEAPPPSLEFMKQQLEMMTSVLENSGNNLSPEMKAKLDTEIKNLLRKVNSRLSLTRSI